MSLTPNQLLIQVGRRRGVLSIKTGVWNATLQSMAQRHAKYQARVQKQGHQNFDERYQELVRALPGYKGFQEIANESWPGQNQEDAAEEMYISWRKSPGHWSVCNGKCAIWGYAMSRGANGIWYAAGLVGQN